jgi:S-formylglutathione hydrolase FrmB
LSATDWWPVRAVLLVLSLIGIGLILRFARRSVSVALAVMLVLTLAVVDVAAAVNASYRYLPTLGVALGLGGADDIRDAYADRARGRVPENGLVVSATLPGTRSGFAAREAIAYLPPAWFGVDRPELPVLVLLHGTPGGPGDWADGGRATSTLDAFAAQHGGLAPVVVMPDVNGDFIGDTECVDSPGGDAETYLTADVPRAVQQQFSTRPPGTQWAIAGFSEGGMCALLLTLRHPGTFGTFGDFSGLLGPRAGETDDGVPATVAQYFGGSQREFAAHDPATLLGSRRFPGTGGWFEVGGTDTDSAAAATRLAPSARQAGIETCLVVLDGLGHSFEAWSAALRDSLPWMAARLGLVPPNPAATAKCRPPPS